MRKLLFVALLALAPLSIAVSPDVHGGTNAAGGTMPGAAADEPLPPDDVYKLTATAQPGAISVHWDILKGYYLYKDKFRFISHVTGIKLGTPEFPKGETKTDPFFGKQEIYHQGVSATVPYTGEGKLDLEIVYQGCAEIGFCYPPQHKIVSLTLTTPKS